MLKGKTIVIGVTGGIAAYKIPTLVSSLIKQEAEVRVIMTENALNFVGPATFEALTHSKCLIDTFDRDFEYDVAHVSLGDKADVMLIAPATANTIAKLARGIADNMLTTTALALAKGTPLIIAPAMNTNMYLNPATQENLKILKDRGAVIIEPDSGRLACGTSGIGKMASPEVMEDYVKMAAAKEKDLIGKKVLITAGPTREALDPVRYITNHSTGKMGHAIAENAMLRGADVTLITGPTAERPLRFAKTIDTVSAKDMYEAVMENIKGQDIVIMSAAVADYRPKEIAENKIKKSDGELSLPLERTQDILGTVGASRPAEQVLCGFSICLL